MIKDIVKNIVESHGSKSSIKAWDNWILDFFYQKKITDHEVSEVANFLLNESLVNEKYHSDIASNFVSDVSELSERHKEIFIDAFKNFKFEACEKNSIFPMADLLSAFDHKSTLDIVMNSLKRTGYLQIYKEYLFLTSVRLHNRNIEFDRLSDLKESLEKLMKETG